ncbi:MAG TPA: hypothetical protein VFI59_02955 [Actinomycetota bacterium]|nr:hypothetical protein [Actinomycetota bacterium]
MSDYRGTLERELERLSPPRIPFDQLARRRDRKRRDQRIRAGVLGLAIVLVMGWLGLSAIRSAPPVPADDPTPTRLGIFADVRGWITYGDVASYEAKGIWAVDPANPDEHPVLLSRGAGLPVAWSSDGSKLLINRGAPYFGGQHSLVVLNSDGSETQVAHADTITGGSFTPEGSKVVYGVTVGGKDWKSGIYTVDAKGGTPQLLYAAARRRIAREAYPTDVFRFAVYFPTLSPDGSRIAYIEGMGDWGNSLWVMNADGTDRHRIIAWEEGNDLVWADSLQWSPDGTRLAFEGSGHEGAGIYVVNSDGSALTVVARGSDLRDPRAPYWSPDGSRIAFQRSTPEGGFQSDGTLYTMAPDGDDVQSLGRNALPFGVLLGPWNPLVPQA